MPGPSPSDHQRRLAAVWFADLVGYSRLASEDEAAALRLLRVFHESAREEIGRGRGHLVKLIGDAAFAEFTSVEAAVRTALALQRRFTDRSAETGHPSLLRIGVHIGDVVTTAEGDLYGDGVNIAARLQVEAQPGHVLVSEDVWRQLRQRTEYHFEALGERELKGLTARVAVFDVAADADQIEASLSHAPMEEKGADTFSHAGETAWGRGPARTGRLLLAVVLLAALGVTGMLGYLVLGTRGSRGEAELPTNVVPPAAPERSIAVLPFENLSADPENAYFSDGITDEILTTLANVGALRVISRTSVMQYKGSSKPLRQIAEELGVAHILEGSVQRAGGRVRINAQLINARTDAHLWAERYDRPLEDIFAVQSEVAQQIAWALQAEITPPERARLARRPTTNPTAYNLVLRSREFIIYRVSVHDNDAGLVLLRQARELDPTYPDAFSMLSRGFHMKYWFTGDRRWLDSSVVAARRAIELDPAFAQGYEALGLALDYRGDRERALEAHLRAVDLNPNLANGLASLYQWSFGHLDEAARWRGPALEMDPRNISLYLQAGRTYLCLGMLAPARELFEKANSAEPGNAWPYYRLSLISLVEGKHEEARVQIQRMLAATGEDPNVLVLAALAAAALEDYRTARDYFERGLDEAPPDQKRRGLPVLAWILQQSGEAERASELAQDAARELERFWGGPPKRSEDYMALAQIRMLEGDREEALRAVEAAVRQGWRFTYDRPNDPILKALKGDPRYDRLMAEVRADVDRMRARVEREGW